MEMKRIILLMLLSILLLTGCQKSIEIKEEYKNEKPISASNIPAVNEIVDIKEGVEVIGERVGDKYIITSLEDEPVVVKVQLEYDPIKIDACTMEVDLSQFLSDPEKQAKASYSIGEDVVKVMYEDSEFEVPYVIVYPRYEVVEGPVIDLYTGYEIEDIVKAPEMEIEHSLDEENSKLNVKLSKGLWSEELSIDVTLVDSNPFPMHYYCHDDEWLDVISNITVYEDGTIYKDGSVKVYGHWYDDGTYYYEGYPMYRYEGLGEEKAKFYRSIRMNGNYAYNDCTLIKN